MNWITFFSAVGGLYALYYAALIGSDIMRKPGQKAASGPPQLVIETDHVPEKVYLEDFPVIQGAPTISASIASVGLGGVSLKELFELSRAKALEYTNPVSF